MIKSDICPLCLNDKATTDDHFIYNKISSPVKNRERIVKTCWSCNNSWSMFESEVYSIIEDGFKYSWYDEIYKERGFFYKEGSKLTMGKNTSLPTRIHDKSFTLKLESKTQIDYVNLALLKAGYLAAIKCFGLEKCLNILGADWPKKLKDIPKFKSKLYKVDGTSFMVFKIAPPCIKSKAFETKNGINVQLPYNKKSLIIELSRKNIEYYYENP